MASSVLTSVPRCILTVAHNKFPNQAARAFGFVTKQSSNWTHTRSLSCLTPKNAIPQSVDIPIACRKYSTHGDHRPSKQLLPPLMEFPKTIWPSLLKTIKSNNLTVSKDDIYYSCPYEIIILFDESGASVQKRFVEITMIFHVLRGLKELREDDTLPEINLGILPEYRDKISICNYRFIKEFTQGFESDWTINVANHFKPSDIMNE